jgi:hypothetical protein
MARRKPAELEIRVAYEAHRTSAQCLAGAYEQLVPIPRRPVRPRAADSPPPAPDVDAVQPLRRTEHG